jgi:hypothetical protein
MLSRHLKGAIMFEFTNFIAAQRDLIAQAPISFITAVVLGASIIWLFKRAIYRDRIAVLNERIRQRDARIEELKATVAALSG